MGSPATRLPRPATVGRPCSIAATLALVGEKWALLAVREIALGNRRFDAIARNTGAPRDILTTRLRSLEAAGIIERRPYQDRPARFEYHLTPAGQDLKPVLQLLARWGDTWLDADPPVAYTHHDHDLEATLMCRTCGDEVTPHTVQAHVQAPGWTRQGPTDT
ncbi:winged helix-turn-helix transcriptional regulator [Yinghuangia seranimata]|uniref:winged helix-turn-helix transcriptional regulator n=1 Tax=Yinghuangia seranimata TaxID=408067 RepID=UPI00248BD42E|nr:helix-turn-helix domain-containing protein [Yinghuangia seranimata]MDI2127106.1 helix-turn-helix domain-containing protein [Yinghuangia seranimata]